MSEEQKKPVTPRPAATVLMLRDGPKGMEVFMVKRHHKIDFAIACWEFGNHCRIILKKLDEVHVEVKVIDSFVNMFISLTAGCIFEQPSTIFVEILFIEVHDIGNV